MRAGKLRNRVTFLEPVESRDAAGGEKINYVDVFTLWTWVEELVGGQALAAGQLLGTWDTRMTVRWSGRANRISAKWRARRESDGLLYDIVAAANPELRNREVQLQCKSGAIAQ